MAIRVPRLWLITAAVTAAACLTFAIAFYPRGKTDEEKFAFAAQRKKAYDTIAQGQQLHAAEEFDEAVAKYQEATEIDPKLASPHYLIGTKLLEEGRFDEAIAEFDTALRLDKSPEHIYNNRGVARMKRGDLDGALSDFEAALAIRPSIRGPRANCGFVRLQRGDFGAAIEDFDAEIARYARPTDGVEVYVGRGIARAGLGDLAGAEEDLNTAVDWARGKRHILPALRNRAILRDKAGNAPGAAADRAEFDRLKDLPKDSTVFARSIKGADEQPTGRNKPQ